MSPSARHGARDPVEQDGCGLVPGRGAVADVPGGNDHGIVGRGSRSCRGQQRRDDPDHQEDDGPSPMAHGVIQPLAGSCQSRVSVRGRGSTILITHRPGSRPPGRERAVDLVGQVQVSTHRPGTFGAVTDSRPRITCPGLRGTSSTSSGSAARPLSVPIIGLEQVPQGADPRVPPTIEGLGARRGQPLGICPVLASGVHHGRVEIERPSGDHRIRLLDDDQPAPATRHEHDGR